VPETTPAETLRKAAALMRDRANAAEPGPWTVDTWQGLGGTWAAVMVPLRHPAAPGAKRGLTAMAKLGTQDAGTAGHIASWDPPMALLVADLLDDSAAYYEGLSANEAAFVAAALGGDVDPGLKLARLFIGEARDA
jgi:hypothetical protein